MGNQNIRINIQANMSRGILSKLRINNMCLIINHSKETQLTRVTLIRRKGIRIRRKNHKIMISQVGTNLMEIQLIKTIFFKNHLVLLKVANPKRLLGLKDSMTSTQYTEKIMTKRKCQIFVQY